MRGKRFLILSLLLALTAYLFDMECLVGGPECCADETVCIAPVTHHDVAVLPLVMPPTPEMGGPPNEQIATPVHYVPFVPSPLPAPKQRHAPRRGPPLS